MLQEATESCPVEGGAQPHGAAPRAGGTGTAQGELYCSGDIIANKYRLLRKIGEGGMGNVWLAVHTALETQVAIKLIRREVNRPGAAERLLREARATAKLRHPAIVRIFDFGLTHRGEPYVVMELLDGATLRDAMSGQRRLEPEAAVQLMLPIASGLAAAHARGIVHRDLKPENILLARDDFGQIWPKIVDFGVAKMLRTPRSPNQTGAELVGTPEYMAPEQALGLDGVDERADVWAFSVALYELVSGRYAFEGESLDDILREVLAKEVAPLETVSTACTELSAIVAKGMRKERDERFGSIAEIGAALARWLLSRGIAEDVTGASVRATWLDGRTASDRPPSAPDFGQPLPIEPEERTTSVALREMRELQAREVARHDNRAAADESADEPGFVGDPRTEPAADSFRSLAWSAAVRLARSPGMLGIGLREKRVRALAVVAAGATALGFAVVIASVGGSATGAMRAQTAATSVGLRAAHRAASAVSVTPAAVSTPAAHQIEVHPRSTTSDGERGASAAPNESKAPVRPAPTAKAKRPLKPRRYVDPDLGF